MTTSVARLRLPSQMEASAELIGPAAFAALATSGLSGSVVSAASPSAAAPVVLAVVAAVIAATRTGRPYTAMLAGMPTYWLTAALLSS